ncbi:MAG: hypothetical protein ACE5G1_13840 [bacterium]
MSLVFFGGCSSIPKVEKSSLETVSLEPSSPSSTVTVETFLAVLGQRQGLQVGDPIFKRNSVAYWITPEIDKLDLDLAAAEENFASNEYQSRLKKLRDLHDKYLIFSLELKMPFYPKWSQKQLSDYLQKNLIITLENGSQQIFEPELLTFDIVERFAAQEDNLPSTQDFEELEVSLPIRVQFKRSAVLLPQTKEFFLKVRLAERLPFRIGFFDEKFYQGFRWKISH